MQKIADAHSDFLSFHTVASADKELYDHADLGRMNIGGVKMQTFVVWVPPDLPDKLAAGLEQIRFLHDLATRRHGHIRICTRAEHLAYRRGVAALIAIEGGESIDCRVEWIAKAYDMGARMLSLTWNGENGFASGCTASGGLKPLGIAAVDELSRLRMALDLSHINEQGFWEAAERFVGAPCASHSCVYDIRPVPRNLKRDQIGLIINRGGFIGVNFYTEFLRGRHAGIDDVLDHIDYLLDCGGEDAVGFGSDFCGIQYTPDGLSSVADFQRLPEAMARRGYADARIQKICYGNFARYVLEFLQ